MRMPAVPPQAAILYAAGESWSRELIELPDAQLRPTEATASNDSHARTRNPKIYRGVVLRGSLPVTTRVNEYSKCLRLLPVPVFSAVSFSRFRRSACDRVFFRFLAGTVHLPNARETDTTSSHAAYGEMRRYCSWPSCVFISMRIDSECGASSISASPTPVMKRVSI